MPRSKWLERISIRLVAWYLRHSPFSKGRWRLTDDFLPRLREVGGGMGERVITTRHGFKMSVDLGEWIGQHIYMTGSYEPATTRLMSLLLQEGNTMIDVGANIGFFALLAFSKVGPSGKVVAFEPVPSTCAALRANLAQNPCADVVVHEIALSNFNGTVTIYEGPDRNRGNSTMRPIAESSARRSVQAASFDSLAIGDAPVHLIKIDVEGAEQLVIEGMATCLRRNRPHLIVEVTDGFLRHFGHSAVSLYEALKALGYEIYEITDRGPVPMPTDPMRWPRQFNAYFSTDSPARVEALLS